MVVKIFMSVFNVHVQRSPVSGRVESVEYKPGKFLHAMNLRADKENEQKLTAIRDKGACIKVKQIAGIIARRIVSWVKEGDVIKQGQRIGMIKFGSQVDLIMPEELEIVVRKGDKVKAGVSVIGRLPTSAGKPI
jgi:phosphatidylserine decarboxylase